MKGKSAEQNILDHLKSNYQWFSAAQLQRMEFHNKNGTLASPKAISRRLQELAEGSSAPLEVDYSDKGHAKYRIRQTHRKLRQVVEELPSGDVRISYVPV